MTLHLLASVAAFCAAAGGYGIRFRCGLSRYVLGLWVGVVAGHVGWGLLFLPDSWENPTLVLQPGAVSMLFVPLGILLVAPFREALAALPLALAVARVGCLPYDCCYPTPWNALLELAGLVGLHFAARRWPLHATPIVLCGFGAIRLLSLPLRRDLVVDPFIDPAWIAAAWIVAGVALRNRLGSAEDAREWFTERTEPLLRALVVMLVIWLLFPLGAEVFSDPSASLLVASSAALALLLALRRPVETRVSLKATAVFGGALLAGVVVASLTEVGLRQLGSTGRVDAPAATAGVVTLVAIAPAFEELLYRERLLGALRRLWGGPWAVVASSALFALGHMDPRVMPIAFVGGVVCGVVMLRTGSLAAVIGLHAGWNLGVVGAG